MKTFKGTKKAITLFLSGILAVGMVSIPMVANAAGTVSLIVSNKSGNVGTDVVISVDVSANSGLAAADLFLKYDNTKLSVKSSKAGAAANGGFASINQDFAVSDNISTIKCSFIHATGITAAGSIMDVTFTIKSALSGSTPLTLTNGDFVDAQFKTLTNSIKNGSVTFSAATPTTTTIASVSTSTVDSTTNTSGTTNTSETTNTSVEGTTEPNTTINITDTSSSVTNEESTVNTTEITKKDTSTSSNSMMKIILVAAAVIVVVAVAAFVIKKKK